MRGVVSQAMVLVAKEKDSEAGTLEFLTPPEGSLPGHLVTVVPESAPELVLNPKKKIFEQVQPHFNVNAESGCVEFLGKYAFTTELGPITVPTIRNAIIS